MSDQPFERRADDAERPLEETETYAEAAQDDTPIPAVGGDPGAGDLAPDFHEPDLHEPPD